MLMTAMVVMAIKLASQVCRRSKYEPITNGDQFSNGMFFYCLFLILLLYYCASFLNMNSDVRISCLYNPSFSSKCRNADLWFSIFSGLYMYISRYKIRNPQLCGSDMWQTYQTNIQSALLTSTPLYKLIPSLQAQGCVPKLIHNLGKGQCV